MKLLIIGHSVLDHIRFLSDEEKVRPGGIFYSTMGFKCFTDENDEISLLTYLDKRNEKYFSFLYSKLNVNYIKYVDSIPVVHLKLFEKEERCERYENITMNLDTSILGSLDEFDGILINMITGFDITLSDFIEIRKRFKGIIYFDVHTLSRGLDEKNRRLFRVIPEAEKWLSNVDIVQVNERELLTLSDSNIEDEIVKEVLNYGVKILIVTKAEKGGNIYYSENNEIKSFHFNALKTNNVNRVGCGDIFGSVFFYNYIIGKDIIKAATVANIAAGCVTELNSLKDFENLKSDTIKRLN